MSNENPRQPKDAATFADQANSKQGSIVTELFAYLRHSRKWWLAPLILMLALIGVLVILGGTSAAPFIYTLF